MSQKIQPKELHTVLENKKKKKVICIDVRTEREYDAKCIAGTVNMPLDHLKNHIGELKKYDDVYVVCASGNRSGIACAELEKCGMQNVFGLEGGMSAWQKEGLPVEGKNKNRLPLIRQVFIAAGSLILAGCILGFLLQELFFFVPIGVGIGLLYAGFSGQCLMMKILMKMPWNN